jgi:hypothetical protein
MRNNGRVTMTLFQQYLLYSIERKRINARLSPKVETDKQGTVDKMVKQVTTLTNEDRMAGLLTPEQQVYYSTHLGHTVRTASDVFIISEWLKQSALETANRISSNSSTNSNSGTSEME